ncbi:DgyrCDS12359 [Dimorphilus gyrociliatus]|uniref:Guanylate cyclase n=1 Tax=Dimorphilus gyrociliatus TaxID=2664684 RepID=A0A7I8W720_9ANNE|nr:DgyrCDS12359 [Dimorphilus gyrociliatus]
MFRLGYTLFLWPLVLTKDINLGILLPFSGPEKDIGQSIAGASRIAIDKINSDKNLLPDREIKFFWTDTACSAGQGLYKVVDMWFKYGKNLHALIGGYCDAVCEPVGLLASHWNLPLISYGCSSSSLSNKNSYPTVCRTVGPFSKLSPMLVAVAQYFNWRRIAIISSTENVWQLTSFQIKVELEASGVHIPVFHSFDPGHVKITGKEKALHSAILKDVKEKARIVIICAYGGDIREMMLFAKGLNMTSSGKYAFITINLQRGAYIGESSWMGDDGRDEEAFEAFIGLLNVHINKPNTEKYKAFEDLVRIRNQEDPFQGNFYETIDVHAGSLYDAVYLYAFGLNKTLETGGDEFNGSLVAKNMINLTYPGIDGLVSIDETGDRNPDYSLQDFKNGLFEDFAEYIYSTKTFTVNSDILIIFPGNKSVPPKDGPDCGWNNEFCPDEKDKSSITIIISFVCAIAVSFTILGIGVTTYLKKKNYEHQIQQTELWKINYNQLELIDAKNVKNYKGGIIRTASSSRIMSRMTDDSSNDDTSYREQTSQQIFSCIARYKGKTVTIKNIENDDIRLTRQLLVELKAMRDLTHDNINQFVGLCLEKPHVSFIENYCPRGSIQDVLARDDKLIDEFQFSFAIDIASGVAYLHNSPLHSHGRLKSGNCLVDSRWIVKLSDFGCPWLRKNDLGSEDCFYQAYFWTAPELLRDGCSALRGTQQGDAYSYGIILQEIISRNVPFYSENAISPKEIIECIKHKTGNPFRPRLTDTNCNPSLLQLMISCWSEEPEKRPTFSEIKKALKKMSGGKETNVMDKMVHMLERYANQLESEVLERTNELAEEKKKTDMLLYRMLPKQVADALKSNEDVTPRSYESVTIYFSDIVGFTQMASESTPLQVVDFLNELYTNFDTIIDNYKVETIGDAYMVTSGVPQEFSTHAPEIATMALDILSCLTTFRIKHMEEKRVFVRIGIHSGPVVTGIVGQKMPRYCLFGDTVNTASRMESTSLALRIQVSETTGFFLREDGSFSLEERGGVSIKGKGTMKTYWLLGKTGFTKTLPSPPSPPLKPKQHVEE